MTFGCQMNVNDSSWLARALLARGFTQAPAEKADVILVNTCSVREKPEQKVISTIGRIRQMTGCSKDVIVGILGCVAQQMGSALFSHSPQVRLVCGGDAIAQAPDAITRLLREPALRISLLDFSEHYAEREKGEDTPCGPTAFVNIMQGCDNFCTYCIVPYTRGRQKSRTARAVLEECRNCLDRGAKEITLLGQNVNAFGRDRYGDGTTFDGLLAQVDALPGLQRLRYTSPHPKDMRAEDVTAFARLEHLCPSLHLPLQCGSDRILKRMARRYGRREYADLVDRLRSARPDIALSTDLIVGFPGETEDDFQETLDLVRNCGFVSSYSFCYSDRPGAKAALFPDKVPNAVSKDRLQRLQAVQEDLGRRWLSKRVGARTKVLLEGESRKSADDGASWQGRDPYGALVHVRMPIGQNHAGRMVDVTIAEAKKHSLIARLAAAHD